MCAHNNLCFSLLFVLRLSFRFLDIVGFTEWSGSREPADVFLLLGTLYGAFDKIALKRGVFKVETIGDCYLAGTCVLCVFLGTSYQNCAAISKLLFVCLSN